MRRNPVNKKSSHRAFKGRMRKTHAINLAGATRRGGIRL